MFRPTGPGKFEIDPAYSGPGVLKALLYNFDLDDFAGYKNRGLKPAHQKFLKERVVPILENDQGVIWMQGSASRIGAADWNKSLSRVRVGNIAAYLFSHGIKFERMQTEAVGAELATKAHHLLDDQRDRSVTMLVLPHIDPSLRYKPPPKWVPPPPKVGTHFKIAMLGDISASQLLNLERRLADIGREGVGKALSKLKGGFAMDVAAFLVWDTDNNLGSIYVYIGEGLGAGLTVAPPIAATMIGDWNDVTTDNPMSCAQFGPKARFTTVGVYKWTLNWIYLETPPGVKDITQSIDTGTTYGIGGSSTLGDFIKAAGPYPYSGGADPFSP
jgi:hypothetical protein